MLILAISDDGGSNGLIPNCTCTPQPRASPHLTLPNANRVVYPTLQDTPVAPHYGTQEIFP